MGFITTPIYCVMLIAFCIHYNADAVLEWLCKSFPLKPGYGNPDMYLDAKLCKFRLCNGVWTWAMSPVKYC